MSDNEEDLNELNSLGCPLWAEYELDEILEWMKKDINIYVNNNSYHYKKQNELSKRIFPRFGIYSILLKDINVFIFDNPYLTETLGDTASTDGKNIFFNFDFYKKLTEMESEDPDGRFGVVPVILHEIHHILDNDVLRYSGVDHEIANISSDIKNNAYLKKAFTNIKWLPHLIDIAFGLKAGDECYATESSEKVIIDVLHKIKTGNSPEISEEEKIRINSDIYLSVEKGRSIDKFDDEKLKNDNPEKHIITKKDLIEALKKAGLENVIKALGLTNENDDIIEEIIEASLEEFDNIMKRNGLINKNSPSGDAVENIKEKIKIKKQPKLTWIQNVINEIWGEGGKETYNMDQPNDMYYVEEIGEMIGFDLFEGTPEKVKSDDVVLVILDTSSSMGKKELSQCLTEIIGIQKSAINDASAKEVIIVFADKSIKEGDIIIIDDEVKIEKFINDCNIEVIGRGGTDLQNAILQSIEIKELKGKNLSSVIIFSDLYDTPPISKNLKLKEKNLNNVSFNYISVSNNKLMNKEFENKVKDYAKVFSLNDGKAEIDLKVKKNDKGLRF